jgi:hypothetical protein
MSCSTEECRKVEAVVGRWLDSHPAEVERIGVWNVFEDESSIVVSILQTDGIRRLTFVGQQAAAAQTPAVESRILNWLDTLSSQPTVGIRTNPLLKFHRTLLTTQISVPQR